MDSGCPDFATAFERMIVGAPKVSLTLWLKAAVRGIAGDHCIAAADCIESRLGEQQDPRESPFKTVPRPIL